VILDTDGNIFGGFTPVEWESRKLTGDETCDNADPTLKSFLFTLKNPHNVPARRFTLKARRKNKAIACDSGYGLHFWDIAVSDNCNTNIENCTHVFGLSYTNDTGRDRNTFFTGSEGFLVKEIEVIEITA
jgi:hypothetical protein